MKGDVVLNETVSVHDIIDAANSLNARKGATRESALLRLSAVSPGLCRIAALAAIHDPNERIRVQATELLEESGTPRDVPVLIEVLTGDPVWSVRASAASSLGKIGGALARKSLLQAYFAEENNHVRRYVLTALSRFDDTQGLALVRAVSLSEDDPMVKTGCLSALIKAGDESAVRLFESFLKDPDYLVRCQALDAVLSLLDSSMESSGLMESILLSIEAALPDERHVEVKNRMMAVIERLSVSSRR